MWTEQVRSMIGTGILETLYMTVVSTVFGYLFGLPMGTPLYHRQRGIEAKQGGI